MRSSIACDKCRTSKTKCENTGINTVCKTCNRNGRPCLYTNSTPVSSGVPLRRESTAADGDGPPKKRRKPLAPTASAPHRLAHGLGTFEDALDSPLLTAHVWEELFTIYDEHLSIDFPFFHKRTFLSSVQQQPHANPPQSRFGMPAVMPNWCYPPLLLAFLTQAARFHKTLSSQAGGPIATAKFYARATLVAMGVDFPGTPTLEKIQTLLLLGYHEWTDLRGTAGWVKIGTAIRCAIALDYPYDAELDDEKQAPSKGGETHLSEKDQFIVREIKRRTFWSCYLMDRYLSWGKQRPSMLGAEIFKKVQLPCSDNAFNYGRKFRTRLLGEDHTAYEKRRAESCSVLRRSNDQHVAHQSSGSGNRNDDIKWEVGDMEGELTWYIQIVDHFGEIAKWSCAHGRQQEGTTPPWDNRTTFKKLDDKLQQLKAALPDHLQLSPDNTEDRIYNKADKYVLIHAMYTTCTVWLYREYMAMGPWGETGPKGPLDPPRITEKPPHPDYWVNQAKACWKACKDFADLLHSIQSSKSHDSLIESPTVAFATFNVALCTIYCHYFPHMDPDDTLHSRLKPRAHDIANGYLVKIVNDFLMARYWIVDLAKWQTYYRKQKADYKKAGGNVGDSPLSSAGDVDRGLRDYAEIFEETHKQFGTKHDKDHNDNDNDSVHWANKDMDMANSKLPRDDNSVEPSEAAVATTLKSESEYPRDAKPATPLPVPHPGFTSVNGRQSASTNRNQVLTSGSGSIHAPNLLNQTPQAVHRLQYSAPTIPTASGHHYIHPPYYNQMNGSMITASSDDNHGPNFGASTISAQPSGTHPSWASTHEIVPSMREVEQRGAQSFQFADYYSSIIMGDNGFYADDSFQRLDMQNLQNIYVPGYLNYPMDNQAYTPQ